MIVIMMALVMSPRATLVMPDLSLGARLRSLGVGDREVISKKCGVQLVSLEMLANLMRPKICSGRSLSA